MKEEPGTGKALRKTEGNTAPKAPALPMAYIGPSIKGVAGTGTVYTNGYPPKLEELMAEYPFFNGLIVPVSDLAHAKKDLCNREGSLYLLFEEAQKVIGGKKHV